MSTKRDRHNSLIEQKTALVAKRDALSTEHTEALIAGEEFAKAGEINDLNRHIEAIDIAIGTVGIQADREDERARADAAADRLKEQGEIILADRLDFVGLMEKAEEQARGLVETLAEIDQLGAKLDSACHEAIKDKTPLGPGQMSPLQNVSPFRPADVATRISQRIGGLLQTNITRGGPQYGSLTWQLSGPAYPTEAWVATEEKLATNGLIHVMRRIDEQVAAHRAQGAAE